MGYKVVAWNKIKWQKDPTSGCVYLSPEDNINLQHAVNHFMRDPMRSAKQVLAKIQEFTSAGDFPTGVREIIDKFHQISAYDFGYRDLFATKDRTNTQDDGFKVADVLDGLTFRQIIPGEKAYIYQMSGSEVTVQYNMYGGGLGWHRTLLDDGQYWELEDTAISFRNKSYASIAQIHYALIEAVGAAQNIAWQAPDPAALATTDRTYTANRDAQTINAAIINLMSNLSTKGYSNVGSDGMTTEVIISCPIQLYMRIRRALSLTLDSYSDSENHVIPISIRVIPTTMYTSTTQYYVIVPGNKMISATRMNPTTFTGFDKLSYTDAAVMWYRFAATIADQEQVQRCAIA